jgi:hypothetical protein
MQQLINGNYFMNRLMVGVLLVGVLGAGARYGYRSVLSHHFLTVTEGQVYQSGAMPPETLKNKVLRYGIRTVIDLRRPGDEVDAERTFLTKLGVKHFHLPSGQVPKDEVVDAFLEIMDNREYRPAIIHCKHGKGRAVLLAAIYRIEYEGWSNKRAQQVAYLQSGLGNFKSRSRKGTFILNYVPRWQLPIKLSFNAVPQWFILGQTQRLLER